MKKSREKEWLCLEIEVPLGKREILSEVLWKLETIGFQEVEEGELLRVRAYFPEARTSDSLVPILSKELAFAGIGDANFSVSTFDYQPETGLEEYRRSFQAFGVGDSFFVYPPWSNPSSEHVVNILMEPSLAFGTGSHESTRLAMQALEAILPDVESLLDVGTGSGILAIAAAKLRPGLRVTAFDIDPLAVHTAALNLTRNGIEDVRLFAGEAVSIAACFDAVVANLTLGLFERLAGELVERCNYHLILSGLIRDQEPAVVDLFSGCSAFSPVNRWQENEWICLHLKS